MKPMTPTEVQTLKAENVPDFVIKAVNYFLVKNNHGQSAIVIVQTDLVEHICANNCVSRENLFKEHMLDFEGTYRSAGWKVSYDKPGYNEVYDAHWIFRSN